MNNLEEFVKSLDLPFEGVWRDNKYREYFVTLKDSDEFSKAFTKISLLKDFSAEDGSIATDDETMFRFTNGIFDIVLSADYGKNIYSLYIEVR